MEDGWDKTDEEDTHSATHRPSGEFQYSRGGFPHSEGSQHRQVTDEGPGCLDLRKHVVIGSV